MKIIINMLIINKLNINMVVFPTREVEYLTVDELNGTLFMSFGGSSAMEIVHS